MVQILHATLKDIPIIRSLAEEIWWPTYSSIVSVEQIRYMLDLIYGENELERVIRSGSQTFIILHDQNGPQGFASYGLRPEDNQICKLHKLYVLPENQGKGYGKSLIDEVRMRALKLNAQTLDLNVNRSNPAVAFYEKFGFVKIKEEDVPIGPYWMNDYVMRLSLDQ
jgi:ribosomal protein S18 acetylase RimI-like enzyme